MLLYCSFFNSFGQKPRWVYENASEAPAPSPVVAPAEGGGNPDEIAKNTKNKLDALWDRIEANNEGRFNALKSKGLTTDVAKYDIDETSLTGYSAGLRDFLIKVVFKAVEDEQERKDLATLACVNLRNQNNDIDNMHKDWTATCKDGVFLIANEKGESKISGDLFPKEEEEGVVKSEKREALEVKSKLPPPPEDASTILSFLTKLPKSEQAAMNIAMQRYDGRKNIGFMDVKNAQGNIDGKRLLGYYTLRHDHYSNPDTDPTDAWFLAIDEYEYAHPQIVNPYYAERVEAKLLPTPPAKYEEMPAFLKKLPEGELSALTQALGGSSKFDQFVNQTGGNYGLYILYSKRLEVFKEEPKLEPLPAWQRAVAKYKAENPTPQTKSPESAAKTIPPLPQYGADMKDFLDKLPPQEKASLKTALTEIYIPLADILKEEKGNLYLHHICAEWLAFRDQTRNVTNVPAIVYWREAIKKTRSYKEYSADG